MLGMKQARKQIRILTVADVPMTFGRKVRQALTGSPISKAEFWKGQSSAAFNRSEARYWAGTSREAAGDNQLLALPFNDAAIHFTVRHILNKK